MRASRAPEQWQQVLDALNKNDYELANKLAFKYNFAINDKKEKAYNDIRHEPLKGDYVAQSPDGKMYCHEIASRLSISLGLSRSYVACAIGRLGANDKSPKSGRVKGWKFWKEK